MIKVSRIRWRPAFRIIANRFPPISLYEDVADPNDLESVFYVEGLTNPRLREELGELHLVADEDRVSGPGTSCIMAAFTHRNPEGTRFSDGNYGVFYAAKSLETAVKETVHHVERFMRRTAEPETTLEQRVYHCAISGEFHDIRGLKATLPGVYQPDNYSESQNLGRTLRDDGSWGIVYDSVRDLDGQCVAVFRPPVISPCVQGSHLGYRWDGTRINAVIELSESGVQLDQ